MYLRKRGEGIGVLARDEQVLAESVEKFLLISDTTRLS